MEDMFKDSAPIGTGLGLVTGGINALYATATQQQQIQAQKDWWYEQQKYLEEHNSPAYQSMKLRKAGLNPYQGVGSHPLGNVSSDLPGRPMELFNTGAISGLMQTLSQLDVNEAHVNQLDAQAGLFGAQTHTEEQRYQTLIQQWFLNEIAYEIGLIDAEERGIKRDELKKAYEEGNYTPTSDTARAADDKHAESVANVANTEADTSYKNKSVSLLDENIKLAQQQIRSAIRSNEIGERYDDFMANYALNHASYIYEKELVDSFILNDLGYKSENIPPVLLPLITRYYKGVTNGDYSKDDRIAIESAFKDILDGELDKYITSSDPNFVSRLDALKHNLNVSEHNLKVAQFNWSQKVDHYNMTTHFVNHIKTLVEKLF